MDILNINLHEWFEQQAKQMPQHIAVTMNDSSLTYAQLSQQSNQLAHALIAKGITSETPVGVCMNRSKELIIVLLGILKAGGAYVPLDPDIPISRHNKIIQDAHIRFLITDELAHSSQTVLVEHTLTWYSLYEKLSLHSLEFPQVQVQAEQLISIYYTSGSTGKPKGVANTHRGWVTAIYSIQKELQLQPQETVLQKTNLGFDDAALEIFWPLVTGGRIALLEPGLHRDPEAIIQDVIRYNVSFLVLVSSMLSRVLDVVTPDQIKYMNHLRGCFGGGEALPIQLGKRYINLGMPGNLYNLWGATELSIGSTLYKCTVTDLETNDTIPIGKPLWNSQIYILDEHLKQVGKEKIGNLYVAGYGLAKGYMHDAERTRQSFIDNPFRPGERMYFTGDQAYMKADGNIQFTGRNDHQVKLRGVRVELGEVESAFLSMEEIREVVVILREDIPTIHHLTAYVILKPGFSQHELDLKKKLLNLLPTYMIPHFIVKMDEFPLNDNSKLDRKALPIPFVNRQVANDKNSMRTKIEHIITEIIADILHLEQVELEDDFFDIGGDSISASRVISKLRSLIRQTIPFTFIFKYRTVRRLANELQKMGYKEDHVYSSRLFKDNKSFNGEILQMSFAQERLWFIQQMDPYNPVYNETLAYQIEGQLDLHALQAALINLMNRHEILRTTFQVINDQPVPVVAKQVQLPFSHATLAANTADELEHLIERRLTKESEQPFDLEKGPLIRFSLFSTSPNSNILCIIIHHIITDAWSNMILLDELNILYTAYIKGKSSPLFLPTKQYAEYAHWHKTTTQSESLHKQLDFWKKELSGELPVLQIPTDKPRPPIQTFEGDKIYFELSTNQMLGLKVLARETQASYYMILQAIFNIMLHRYSGQNDLIIGSPIANRNEYELERMVGFFVNTVAIRSQFNKEHSFLTYLHHVKERCLRIYDHQDMPFEILVKELQPERNQAYSPIVQVMFAYQNQLEERLELADLEVLPIEVNNKTARFELTLFLKEIDSGKIEATFEYNSRLFTKQKIKYMQSSFCSLLDGVLNNPNITIGKLPLLSDEYQKKIIYKQNHTAVPFPSTYCLHELFEQQVKLHPDHVAAIYQNVPITYIELEKRSNQLAYELLLHWSVSPNSDVHKVVGVGVERSLELVISLMAILKAGAAFVPIDMELPEVRIQHILQDAGASLCIVQECNKNNLKSVGIPTICIDSQWETIKKHPYTKPECQVKPQSLVSIYYTSGSTGKPKGVLNVHEGWVNRICWMQKQFHLQAGEKVLQKTTLTFDDAAVEFFWPLSYGGCVALLEPGLHRDPRSIIDACIQYEVVHVQFVPSMLNLVLDELTTDEYHQLYRLRSTISSGEPLTANIVKHFFSKMPGTLNNTWGATEVSIDSTLHVVVEQDMEAEGAICIGKPIDNNRCYVLDDYLQPVPPGVTGMLYISGIGLAQGYRNLPNKTAEAFIPDPFFPGERMYYTGDLGFYHPDGSLHFSGRLDNQVKIRGMRVELSEIEAVLRLHNDVKEAVVILHEDVSGIKILLAYIVPITNRVDMIENEIGDMSEQVRKYAQSILPDYMVPTFIILLEQMPLNANGKIDRSQLIKPEKLSYHQSSFIEKPESEIEKYIADIWIELLQIEGIGIHDHFFDVGGHSLLATQIVSRIRRQLKLNVPLREVFLHPTIRQFAALVEEYMYKQMEQLSDEEVNDLLKS
ncbi:Linear gramicidin synthase subunit B [Paenibacillus nuruki]|uniref:Linear gramicidin synthase subunit B n=1 Tax=Paenibacillus nuruki TaxID=1886670 RepID=A0A1E3L8H4_9BACL|nr:non-ribosomal peptide synthetase [Paenibacillus nuruki]ODP30117.1 Linear gramicidin synthase subunit B [Paenibacillus nuruki]